MKMLALKGLSDILHKRDQKTFYIKALDKIKELIIVGMK